MYNQYPVKSDNSIQNAHEGVIVWPNDEKWERKEKILKINNKNY